MYLIGFKGEYREEFIGLQKIKEECCTTKFWTLCIGLCITKGKEGDERQRKDY